MTKIKFKLIQGSNALIAFILSLLGFTQSCEPIAPEYGTPSATFILDGKVTDADKQEGIEGIQVVMQYDTTKTDQDGNYEVSIREFPTDQSFTLNFIDIDSLENGLFVDVDSLVKYENPDFKNGDGFWYAGEVKKTLNISMVKK